MDPLVDIWTQNKKSGDVRDLRERRQALNERLKEIRFQIRHRLFVFGRKWHCHPLFHYFYPKKSIYRRLLAVFLAFFILVPTALFLLRPTTARANWYNTSWSYRNALSVSNSGSALTDYQVKITLDTASLITAGKMQSDCDDIRFTSSDGTTIQNYFIESGCNTATTIIWVRVSSIPAGGTTIYIYYGNSAVTAGSNGENTFLLFDDFSGSSPDLTKWDITLGGSGAVNVSNSIASLTIPATANQRAEIDSKNTFTKKAVAARARMSYPSEVSNRYIVSVFGVNGDISNNCGFWIWDTNEQVRCRSSNSDTTIAQAIDNNAYHIYETKWGSTTLMEMVG